LGREIADRDPVRTGLPDAPEQAKLETEIDEPGAMEAAKARDEVVEAVVEGHLRAIVAWPLSRPPVGGGTVRSRAAAACNGPRGSRVLGDDGYRQLADRGAGDRSRWIVRGARADAS